MERQWAILGFYEIVSFSGTACEPPSLSHLHVPHMKSTPNQFQRVQPELEEEAGAVGELCYHTPSLCIIQMGYTVTAPNGHSLRPDLV